MKNRVLKVLFTVMLALTIMLGSCLPALAAASNISVGEATYYGNNSLKSVACKFDWSWGMASVDQQRLVLMTQKLSSGNLTNLGTYGNSFSSFEAALSYDNTNGTFGIVQYSDEAGVDQGSRNNKRVFNFAETDIPLDVDKIYYVYLWTYYRGYYYPDNFFCAIRVKDRKVSYSTDPNMPDDSFKDVDGEDLPNPNPNPNPQPPVVNEVPETGDAFNTAMWILLLCVGCAGIVAMTAKKSRKEN